MAAAKAAWDADDLPQAIALYQDAADYGSAEAASRLAQIYLEGGVAPPPILRWPAIGLKRPQRPEIPALCCFWAQSGWTGPVAV